jgi:chorismate synthase
MNTYGKIFRITTFGESHGAGIGVVIDGCPAGLPIDTDLIQSDLDRRRPAQSKLVSQRNEADQLHILSGVWQGKSTGTPIALYIANNDAKSTDYDHLIDAYRPSHADFTYDQKYGFRDHRGGGRASARETVARVAAGAIAKILLQQANISITAYTAQIGNIALDKSYHELNLSLAEQHPTRCPDPEMAMQMENLIREVRKAGDTTGGVVSAVAKGVPAGWGEPVFDKLHAELGKAMLSINAAKGFEYGSGFGGVGLLGSQHNDIFVPQNGQIKTLTNYSGGIQGGISNGMDIYFRVAFKPVATIMQTQTTVNRQGEKTQIAGRGRHDPCVVPRAVVVVEAMTALVLADFMLRHRNSKL